MQRRMFISLAGGGAVAAAGAALGWSHSEDVPSRANAPWREAGQGSGERRVFLSYAILAPNPHNLQPWKADLSRADEITLFHDPARLLKETDPFSRQLMIGHGCFLETLAIAAARHGRKAAIELFPEGEPDLAALDGLPVARIRFAAMQPAGGELFDAIVKRRSVKEPFDMSRMPSGALVSAAIAAGEGAGAGFRYISDAALMRELRAVLAEGMRIEMNTPAKFKESVDLMRIGRAEIIRNPDGIDLGGLKFDVLRLAGLISREALADPASSAFKAGLARYDAIAAATPAVIALTTAGNSRMDQIAAGRAYMRVALKAAAAGLALHPMSQALQEYSEMAGLKSRTEAMLEIGAPECLQMLVRIGYGPPEPPAPRRPLKSMLIG